MESKRSKKENSGTSEEHHDPFAVDLFGGRVNNDTQVGLKSVAAKPLPVGVSRDWHSSLQSILSAGNDEPVGTPGYPVWLEPIVNERLMPSLRSLTSSREGLFHFEIISFEDSTAVQALDRLSSAVNLFVRFEFEGAVGLITLSTEIAGEIIDGVLSGPGNKTGDLRPLSKIELAICAYVAGSALSELNECLDGRSRLRILSVSNESPGKEFGTGRIVDIVADLVAGELSGMISILLPFEMAVSLNEAFRAAGHGRYENEDAVGSLEGETGIFLNVGRTAISAVEIPFLEPDDIVLIKEPAEKWWDGGIDLGVFECYVGVSSNIRLKGKLNLGSLESGAAFEIREAFCEPAAVGSQGRIDINRDKGAKGVENQDLEARLESDAEILEETTAGNAGNPEEDRGLIALENVMVDLRVQVAGRKMSLADLGRIRAGQIIDLGCRPEDPVELIAESSDRPIASGELVKIEDQLGVRVTKVFV